MTLNRIGVVLGLAVLAGVVVASLPRGAMGAQRGGDSGSATVHSIKVTLAPSGPGDKSCELRPLIPDAAGVYPGDTVRFNVENGCDINETVSISDATLVDPPKDTARLFRASEKWPKTVSVPRLDRRHIDVEVLPDALNRNYVFQYTVTLAGSPDVPGRIYMCQQPPCLPTGRKPGK